MASRTRRQNGLPSKSSAAWRKMLLHQAVQLTVLLLILEQLNCRAAASSACFEAVGCFDNSPPYNFASGLLPASPSLVGTKFQLYTRTRRNGDGELITYTGETLNSGTAFNSTLPVKVIIHGFTQGNEPWMTAMKDALLQELACNVILVNWTMGALAPDYLAATANTRLVGRQIALLLRKLQRSGSTLSNVHLIGLSLGAHVSGFTGSELGGAIGRISGLDPAGPDFDGKDPRVRLDPLDAKFVDVIHTNAAPLLDGGFGVTTSIGHVDFYPNGGKSQPGCLSLALVILQALFDSSFSGIAAKVACHHVRSVALFIESIPQAGCRFTAHRCPGGYNDYKAGKCGNCNTLGCSEMGYHADKYQTRGDMYLSTRSAKPFCLP